MKLDDILADPALKSTFVEKGVALIDAEVGSKRGLSGMALKGGYKTIQKVKPDVVGGVLDMLLPHFAPEIEPFFAQAQESGDVAGFFATNADPIAEAMLGVTDRRAEVAKNPILKKTYFSLRGQAKKHTVEAMPGVGRLLAGFLD